MDDVTYPITQVIEEIPVHCVVGETMMDPFKTKILLDGEQIGCVSKMTISIDPDKERVYTSLRVFDRSFKYIVKEIAKDTDDLDVTVIHLLRGVDTSKETHEDIRNFVLNHI